ncbi:hypothetical protein [Mycoplasmopsis felis]|uniref:hypothetical protein n=1 Tax=Mycoplasmopsis felis TaxID=33923 RepID=UPI002B0010B9|nr:hypothetical protein [Mycoplasmopsis felis]WQQ08487.1 hypothetical protein RRG61_04165 [Mycoplasmopsis felis]
MKIGKIGVKITIWQKRVSFFQKKIFDTFSKKGGNTPQKLTFWFFAFSCFLSIDFFIFLAIIELRGCVCIFITQKGVQKDD